MTADRSFWSARRVLITGHTGFKGAWLAAQLQALGAQVSGFALEPEPGATYLAAGVGEHVASTIGDIRDPAALRVALGAAEPDIVLHLAAQSLVRRSYAEPVETFDVNVTGTAAVLDAATTTPSVRVVLVVTSDKVYANDGSGRPFVESDPLGGGDPYSASKSAAEMVARSWQYRAASAGGPAVVVARAGNVIGGGDRAPDRLLPDLFRALGAGEALSVRHPDAVRPWQFVLEPLAGYLAYVEAAWERPGGVPPALNFGPDRDSCWAVGRVLDEVTSAMGEGSWQHVPAAGDEPEASLLLLDSTLAASSVGWRPLLDLPTALRWTAEWHRTEVTGGSLADLMAAQIDRYEELTRR